MAAKFAPHGARSPQMPVQESGLGAGSQGGHRAPTTYPVVSGLGAGTQSGFKQVQMPTGGQTSFPNGGQGDWPYGKPKGGRALAPGKKPQSPYGSYPTPSGS